MMLPAAAARFWAREVWSLAATATGDRAVQRRRRPAAELPPAAALGPGHRAAGRRGLPCLAGRRPPRQPARPPHGAARAPHRLSRHATPRHASSRSSSALALLGLALPLRAQAPRPLQVVASFSILADMLREVAGDAAQVHSLVGANADAHVFEPTPADAQRLAKADLVVVNGLHFEGWIDRLVRSSGYRGPVVEASRGIEPRQPGPRGGPARLAEPGARAALRREHARRAGRGGPGAGCGHRRPRGGLPGSASPHSTRAHAPRSRRCRASNAAWSATTTPSATSAMPTA